MGAEYAPGRPGSRQRAAVEADRAEAQAWSIRMEGYGGPARPSPTIAQCLRRGLGWLEVECHCCKTRASLPLNTIRRPRETPIWKLEASLKCRSCRKGRSTPPPGAYDQADRGARDHAVQVGASRRGEVRATIGTETCGRSGAGSVGKGLAVSERLLTVPSKATRPEMPWVTWGYAEKVRSQFLSLQRE